MKNKTVIQDYLFSSALVFKTIALFITLYALDAYAGVVFERNPVTRLLLQNNLVLFSAELATFALMCFGYHLVRRTYLSTNKMSAMRLKPDTRNEQIIRWSFNALIAFIFLLYLWDAANDVIILLATCLPGIHC